MPQAKLTPIELPVSAQMRVRRLLGERAFDEGTKTLRIDLSDRLAAPAQLRTLLDELVPPAPDEMDVAG